MSESCERAQSTDRKLGGRNALSEHRAANRSRVPADEAAQEKMG